MRDLAISDHQEGANQNDFEDISSSDNNFEYISSSDNDIDDVIDEVVSNFNMNDGK